MAINVGIIRSFFVSSWIISHLGRNPERGGRPIDSMVVKINAMIKGILFHIYENDSVVVDELHIII